MTTCQVERKGKILASAMTEKECEWRDFVSQVLKVFLGGVAVVGIVLAGLAFWAKREASNYEVVMKKAEDLHLSLKPYNFMVEGDEKEFFETCLDKQRFDGTQEQKHAFCRCKTVNTKEYVLPILPNPDKTMMERYKKLDMRASDLLALVMAIDKGCFDDVKKSAAGEAQGPTGNAPSAMPVPASSTPSH
jgi:hypothetical protein